MKPAEDSPLYVPRPWREAPGPITPMPLADTSPGTIAPESAPTEPAAPIRLCDLRGGRDAA